MTQILKPELTAEQIKAVGAAAKGCKIVAFPTDTVYGIGSTALIKAASRRIYQIKERPSIKPLPIFVHSIDEARKWVQWTETAEKVARAHWPGPVTLVLKTSEQGRLLTFPEYQTLAIRVPNHPVLLKIIEASGVPWVQTSANKSGQPSLTEGADVVKAFDGIVDWIVDGGKTPGVESTIVDAVDPNPRVIRQGAVAVL